MTYKYDQLNRIKETQAWAFSNNVWTAQGNRYKEGFSYDGNGNIMTLKRYNQAGGTNPIDNLTYSYSITQNNRLNAVADAGNAIEGLKGGSNYSYDDIGNLTSDAEGEVTSIKWTVYGKIEEVNKVGNKTIKYRYDGTGNRAVKMFYEANVLKKTTYYFRDASGNVMGIYEQAASQTEQTLIEQPIYGSSRIGIYKAPEGGSVQFKITLGYKQYELSNHLANTLVTISDNKVGVSTDTDNKADFYQATVLSATDYYAFGMSMKERSWQSESYRYGFNGKEKDKDFGEETTDFGARLMNSKIGRWMAVDPLFRKYPELSPYNFVADNPLNAIDPDGRKILFVNGYYNTGWLSGLAGSVGLKDYWGEKFVKSAGMYLENTEKFKREFIDGRGKWNSTGEERFDAGYEYAKANYASITNGIFDAKGVQIETIKVVSHSMGGAYSEGMIKYLEEKGVNVEKVVHLSPADPSGFTASPNPMTLQINLEFDIVLGYKNFFEVDKIEGVDAYGDVKTEKNVIVDLFQSHMATKCEGCGAMLGMSGAVFEWGMVKDLESINFEKKGNTFATPYGTITGSSNVYNAVGNANNTQFNRVYTRSSTYTPTNKKNEYKLSNL